MQDFLGIGALCSDIFQTINTMCLPCKIFFVVANHFPLVVTSMNIYQMWDKMLARIFENKGPMSSESVKCWLAQWVIGFVGTEAYLWFFLRNTGTADKQSLDEEKEFGTKGMENDKSNTVGENNNNHKS